MITGRDEQTSGADRAGARFQLAIAAAFFFLLGLALAVAQLLDRDDLALVPGRISRWRAVNSSYLDCRYYRQYETRMLNDVIPAAHFSEGGVFFLGSSCTQALLMTFALPVADQNRVLNLAFSAARHSQQLQFVRFLQSEFGLLAGGAKTVVVLELAFECSTHEPTAATSENDRVWERFFTGDGLATYDSIRGIEPASADPWWNRAKRMQIRTRAVWGYWSLFPARNQEYLRIAAASTDAKARDYWSERFGANWQSGMDVELSQLAQTIDYLKAHGVAVLAVWVPQKSWTKGFPPAERYRNQVRALLAGKGVRSIDWLRRLDDSEFADSLHANYLGSQSLLPDYLGLIRSYRDPQSVTAP